MSYFDALLPEVPFEESLKFFAFFKKQAAWEDPPDMDGSLEGQFNVPVDEVLHTLKTVIAGHFRKMVAYYTYAQSFRGPWWRGVKIEFSEHAGDEQSDAEFFTKRAVALGGPVHMDPIEPPPPSNDPVGILKTMMRAEQEHIALLRKLRMEVGDQNPMYVGIDEALHHAQHHLDEFHQHLTQVQSQQLQAPPMLPPMEEPLPDLPEDPTELPPEVDETLAKAASKQSRGLTMTDAAKLVGGGAMLGAGIYGLAGAGRRAIPVTQRLIRGGGTGAAVGLATAGMIGAGQLLSKMDPKGHGVDAVVKLAPALASTTYGVIQDSRKEASKRELTPEERAELENKFRQARMGGAYSGVRSLMAEAVRTKGRRGQRAGKEVGTIAGALAGAAAGRKAIGGTAGTIAGMAAGALSGRGIGKELGKERDARALMKRAFAMAKLANPEDQAEDAAMASPSTAELQPQHYLQAEMIGQQAQAANEAGFYRNQLTQAQQQVQSMQEQMMQAQMQMQQLQQQAAQTGAQVQQAAQEAMQARDDAVAQTVEAAKARIGAQKMREQLLQIASQDPAQIGEAALAPQPALPPDAGLGQPPQEGPAGLAPDPQQPPPEGDPAAVGLQAMPADQMKTGSAFGVGGALIGAGLGVGSAFYDADNVHRFQDRVSELERGQDGSFQQATALAKAKERLAKSETAKSHLGRTVLARGIGGAALGLSGGESLQLSLNTLAKNKKDAIDGLKMITGGYKF